VAEREGMSDILTELVRARDGASHFDLTRAAAASLAKNVECFVAQHFLLHPTANPKNLILCYQPELTGFGYKFWIQEKP
jgi:hypothetical protein